MGVFFHTTVGVCLGGPPSPVLLNIFLDNIMRETLYDHHTSIPIGGNEVYALQTTSIL